MDENKISDIGTDPPEQAINQESNEKGFDCLFSPTGKKKTMNGNEWIECASICRSTAFQCFCHGKSNCVSKWHRTDENQELFSQSISNHAQKLKTNNYTI